MNEYAFYLLVVCPLLGVIAFLARLNLQLTNRLMSRNFYEFKAADTKPAKPKAPEIVLEERDEHAENQASQLNAILHIG